jgi:hypothetical protein
MPVHDWNRADAGLFHHFHQQWIAELCARLNGGSLPAGYYALIEQHAGAAVPDVLTFERLPPVKAENPTGSLAVATTPPRTRFVMSAETDIYTAKANRITVRHPLGDVVAVLEIVSPGNKKSRHALDTFIEKSLDLLSRGISLLVIDLLPPTKRDPQGIHGAIWQEIDDEPFELPPDKPLTLVSYAAGPPKQAFVEPVAVGDTLPSMPLFLASEVHVPVPLEESYERTWSLCPQPLRELVEHPV